MNSIAAFLVPIITLVHFLEISLSKNIKKFVKAFLGILLLVIFVFDLFVTAVFYVNCKDVQANYGIANCIEWVYPTLDFLIMAVLSLAALFLAVIGMARNFQRKIYLLLGAVVIFTGLAARLFVLITSSDAIIYTIDVNNTLIFQIFSVIVVYGLISSAIYSLIFFLKIFAPSSLKDQR